MVVFQNFLFSSTSQQGFTSYKQINMHVPGIPTITSSSLHLLTFAMTMPFLAHPVAGVLAIASVLGVGLRQRL
jgi:hypothetical protein